MKVRQFGLAATSALFLASSVAAFAASDTSPSQMIRNDQMRASEVIGSNVYDQNNQKVGSVKDLILGKGGRVDSVVLDVGSYLGMGGKYVAVQLSDIKTDNNRLTLSETKQQLAAAPSYDISNSDTGAGKGPSPVGGGSAANPK